MTTLLFIGLTVAASIETCKYGNPGAVYVCTGPDFTESCHYYTPKKQNDCFTMTEKVHSIGPDKGSYCVLFTTSNCEQGFIAFGPEPQ
jgi:hypothetical protein